MKSILDKEFEYTSSAKTDLKKTFARVRREIKAKEMAQAEQEAYQEAADREALEKVSAMPSRKRAVDNRR